MLKSVLFEEWEVLHVFSWEFFVSLLLITSGLKTMIFNGIVLFAILGERMKWELNGLIFSKYKSCAYI